ncbi:MAG: crosslink repair DNA glycosylase YcaQ family protein [Burkholderiaceae bacterium]
MGWAYRFEAYTPAAKRVRGYYAMPLLWRANVIGWANLSVNEGQLDAELGYVQGHAPTETAYPTALDDELRSMARFLDARPGSLRERCKP